MKRSNPEIKIALPDGHLQEDTGTILYEAGIKIDGYNKQERNYRPSIAGQPKVQLKILRPQEIPNLVAEGTYDVGVTGADWLEESGADVEKLLDLEYGHVQVVLAISTKTEGWRNVRNVDDLLRKFWKKKTGLMISTEYLHLTQAFISNSYFYKAKKKKEKVGAPKLVLPWSPGRKNTSPVKVVLSFGSTEGKPPEDADAIVDNTSTGKTLKENNLIIVDNVMRNSTAWLFANKDCLAKASTRASICHIANSLHQVVKARKFIHIFANIPNYDQSKLRISRVSDLAQHDVTVVQSNRGARIDLLIEREDYDEALSSLRKELKATDIIAIRPERIAWPSKGDNKTKAPYMGLYGDTDIF